MKYIYIYVYICTYQTVYIHTHTLLQLDHVKVRSSFVFYEHKFTDHLLSIRRPRCVARIDYMGEWQVSHVPDDVDSKMSTKLSSKETSWTETSAALGALRYGC